MVRISFVPGEPKRYAAQLNGTHMSLVACLAIALLLQESSYQPSAEDMKSIKSSTEISMAGASETVDHPLWIGEKPTLPIRDKNGNIHPGSCNPSFRFNANRIDKAKLTALLPHFKNILPYGHASHVDIYLPKHLFKHKEFIDDLQKQPPNCKIYEHSREHVLGKIKNKPRKPKAG